MNVSLVVQQTEVSMYVITNSTESLHDYLVSNCKEVLLNDIREHAGEPAKEIYAMLDVLQRCDTYVQQLGELFRLVAERNLCERLAERFNE